MNAPALVGKPYGWKFLRRHLYSAMFCRVLHNLIISLLCLIGSLGGLCAQDSIIGIAYSSSPFQIDGDPADWGEEFLEMEYVQQNDVKGDANTAWVHLAWDESNLYLMADVRDNAVHAYEDSLHRLHLNDAVELYLDPLHDSGRRMDLNDYQFIVAASGKHAILKGELSRIADTTQTAPKEFGISTLVYTAVSKLQAGGYCVEMQVPFAGIGLLPQEGKRMRMDFCMNDLDTLVDIRALPDGVEIPRFFFSNWRHDRDFSYPHRWLSVELQGHADAVTALSRKYAREWLYLLAAVILFASALVVWMAYRIRQLKHVPEKRQVPQWERVMSGDPPSADAADPGEPGDQASPAPTAPEHPAIEKCRAYILAHLDEEVGPETLASHCAVSLRQLQRVFKENLGISPGNLVAIIKMERAASMLSSGKYNVNETAHALGFQDGSYFSRVFRKYHGHAPSQLVQQKSS